MYFFSEFYVLFMYEKYSRKFSIHFMDLNIFLELQRNYVHLFLNVLSIVRLYKTLVSTLYLYYFLFICMLSIS